MTKLLVVDDDIAINELIKVNLELLGFDVVQAYNGTEGFALAKQEIPSLIVLLSSALTLTINSSVSKGFVK